MSYRKRAMGFKPKTNVSSKWKKNFHINKEKLASATSSHSLFYLNAGYMYFVPPWNEHVIEDMEHILLDKYKILPHSEHSKNRVYAFQGTARFPWIWKKNWKWKSRWILLVHVEICKEFSPKWNEKGIHVSNLLKRVNFIKY